MTKRFSTAIGMAIALVFAFAGAASGQTAVELFQKAKQQVKAGGFADALKTLDALDALTAQPGHEAERRQVEPAIAFYRGISQASLGRLDDGRAQFEKYLGFVPNASIDASLYSKKTVGTFEEARKNAASAQAGSASVAESYKSFRIASTPAETPNEAWGEGPVKYLMTSDEKREWTRASDPVTRSEFVTKFWAARDPKPETPENEFRNEFARRVAYADANFAQGETRGSLTDRGMVFALLGPPTYVGRRPIGAGEDSNDASGMSTTGRHDTQIALNSAQGSVRSTSAQTAGIVDRTNGPNSTALDSSSANWREVWHYRRELLPSAVGYQQVDFDFITRKGYGQNVLQRDSAALATIEAARRGRPGV